MHSRQQSEEIVKLAGDFAVDANGSATYDFHFDLPPGTAGMRPDIGLSYNSGRGQGLPGVGWTISGLSAISRVPNTVAQDGVASGSLVGFDGQPPACFALDGNRLIAIKDPLYRTELNNGDVVFFERDSDGSNYWLVATKDGRRMEYGRGAAARARTADGKNVAIWALNRVFDRCGNYYTIDYLQEDGADLRPIAINYSGYNWDLTATDDPGKRSPPPPAGGKPASIEPQRRIDFTYSKVADPVATYSQGVKSTGQWSLTGIATSVAGEKAGMRRTVSKWDLGYQASPVSGRPLLVSINTQQGPIRFEYPGAPQPLSVAGALQLVNDQGQPYGFVSHLVGSSLIPADFNGDGRPDFFYITADGLTGKVLTVVGVTAVGDGKYKPAIVLSLATPTDGVLAWSDFLWATTVDVDGDGLVELVIAMKKPNRLLVFKPVQQGGGPMSLTQISSYPMDPNTPFAKGTLLPVALYGDGTTTLLYTPDGGQTATFIQPGPPSKGNVQLLPMRDAGAWPLFATGGAGQLLPIDIDGDGRTHFVRAWSNAGKLCLSVVRTSGRPMQRVSFTLVDTIQTGLAYDGCKILVGDINGDGLNDIVWVGKATGAVLNVAHFLNTGGGFVQVKPATGEITQVAGAFTREALALIFLGLAPERDSRLNKDRGGWDDTLSDGAPLMIADALLQSANVSFFQGQCNDWLKFDYSLADIDGDGRTELVAVARANYTGGSMNGDSFHFQWHVEDVAQATLAGTRSDNGALSATRLGGTAPKVVATNKLANVTDGGMSMTMDLEGSGKAGLIYIMPVIGSAFDSIFFFVSTPASTVDLAQTITNELGGTISLGYKPLNDSAVHSNATAARGAQMLEAIAGPAFLQNQPSTATALNALITGIPGIQGSLANLRTIALPKYLVASYTRDVTDPPSRTECFYSGARYDVTGRGWLGFDTVRFAEPALELVRETCQSQVFPYTGRILATSLQRGTSARPIDTSALPVLQGSVTRYGEIPGMPPGVHQVTVDNSIDIWTDGSNVTERKTVQLVHNSWGDMIAGTEEIFRGEAGGPMKSASKIVKKFTFAYPMLRSREGPLTTLPADRVDWRVWAVSQCMRAEQRDGGDAALITRDYTYRPDNGLIATVRDGDSPQHLVTHAYDPYGNRTKTTDALGGTVETVYDAVFNTFGIATKRGGVAYERFVWDPGFGRMTRQTDANGINTLYSYDELGRLVRVQAQPDANTEIDLVQRNFTGPSAANVDELVAVGDGNWLRRSRVFDRWGRLSQEIADAPDGGITQTNLSYDSRNNMVLRTQTKPAGVSLSLRREFNAVGHLTKEEVKDSAEANTVTTSWEWLTSWRCVEQCANVSATLEYATFNDQRRLTGRFAAGDSPEVRETTTWRYDALGRELDVVDPAGTITSTRYDLFGRVIETSYASEKGVMLQKENIAFTDADRSRTRTDLSKQVIQEKFDALGRITSRALQSQEGWVTLNSWTWDGTDPGGKDRLASTTAECQMLQADGGAAKAGRIITDYRYDWRGNPATVTQTHTSDGRASDSYMIAYEYTLAGNLASMTYPNGAKQTNSFNAQGSLQAIQFQPAGGDVTRIAAIDWNSSNGANVRNVMFANGVLETTRISMQGRLVSRQLQQGRMFRLDPDKLFPDESWAIVRDAFGNPTSIGDRSYSYGKPPRLIGATAPGTDPLTYRYVRGDRIDDRLGVIIDAHRVVRVGANNVDYDQCGNLTSLPALTPAGRRQAFSYDALGQLVAGDGIAAGASFAARYDSHGRRVIKQGVSAGGRYHQRSIDPCYEVTDYFTDSAKVTQIAILIMGPDGPIAQWADTAVASKLWRALPQGLSYLHADHLGSVVRVTDGKGGSLSVIRYSPFGELLSESACVTRRLFTGHEYDDETGLHYMRARYYHPRLGLFIQPDDRPGGPIASNDAYNRYAYAANRPLTFIDPTGHSFIEHLFSSLGLGFLNTSAFKTIMIFSVSMGLIFAGVLVTAFTMGIGTILGAGLMAAGIAGLVTAVTTIAMHEDLSYDGWAIQIGIGFVTGAAMEGMSFAVSEAVSSALEGVVVATRALTAARTALNVVSAAAARAATTVFENAVLHQDLAEGLAFNVAMAAGTAAVTGEANKLQSKPTSGILSDIKGVWNSIGKINQAGIKANLNVAGTVTVKIVKKDFF